MTDMNHYNIKCHYGSTVSFVMFVGVWADTYADACCKLRQSGYSVIR